MKNKYYREILQNRRGEFSALISILATIFVSDKIYPLAYWEHIVVALILTVLLIFVMGKFSIICLDEDG